MRIKDFSIFWRVWRAWWAWRAWLGKIIPCVAMPTCIAPAASMAAQDEFAPLCAIQGMSISHYASWANASRAINTIAVLCVHCDGNYRRSPITSIQSRRCSLIISICTTKAITDCCSKTRIRTCTHMHMHNHMFINYGIEGDRRSLPLPALCSKASVRTCTHMHMHTHKQHTHTHCFQLWQAITDHLHSIMKVFTDHFCSYYKGDH